MARPISIPSGGMLDPKAFKAYDVRGIYPDELDEAGAYAIGRAYVEQFLADSLGRFIPIFAGPPSGTGFFAAGVVLAIMIVPTISAVTREVFVTVPQDVREAAFALGATRWEVIRYGVLPPARAGIVGAVILGLGRALGETVAVLLLIGQIPSISKSIFSGGYSMASVIANEFGQSQEPLHLQALIAIGLLLFAVTVVMNIAARILVGKAKA